MSVLLRGISFSLPIHEAVSYDFLRSKQHCCTIEHNYIQGCIAPVPVLDCDIIALLNVYRCIQFAVMLADMSKKFKTEQ